jgi:hypothetical protein
MKTKQEIENKIKESEEKIEKMQFATFSEMRKTKDWILVLNWVLDKEVEKEE